MADDAVAHSGSQDDTPVATKGFGAREDADTTRQAQHTEANDAPDDVSLQRVMCRSQALTVDILGKEFGAAAARRTAIFDKDAVKP